MATPNQTPVIPINPDIEVMKPEDFEPPEMLIVVDEPPGQKYCPHDEIRVYPHHRIVQCRKCHKTIDPFEYILQSGQQAHNILAQIKYLKVVEKDLRVSVEEKKKELTSLKNRLK